MRHLGEDQLTQEMGLGSFVGEVRQSPDGNLYQWVQGVDGLGNPVGFWRALRRLGRRALPLVRRLAPLVPGGVVATALRQAAPLLRRVQPVFQQFVAPPVPDVVPTVPATAPAEAAASATPAAPQAPEEVATAGWGLSQDELPQVMGIGHPGDVAHGSDGNLYQWMQGVDGLGNPVGFWRRLGRRLLRRALPFVQRLAPFVPGVGPAVAAGLRVATPVLQRAGVAGASELGALYQAPDGTLYQVQGPAEDAELRGLAEEEELRGVAEDEELRGFAEDEELRGVAEDEELRGLAEDEELRGFAEEEELRGAEGYVREDGTSGLEAYVKEEPPQTPWFTPPTSAHEIWKPLW